MICHRNTYVNWCPLESDPENSGVVSRLKSYGDCVFSVAASTLWNRLATNIRNALSLENTPI